MAVSKDVLVIFDGSLGAITACTSARFGSETAGRLCVWGHPSIQSQWTAFLDQFEAEWIANNVLDASESTPDASMSVGLLAGSLEAARLGISEVVWPIHAGVDGKPGEMDLDAASTHVDRALLVTRLTAMDAAQHKCVSIRVETPYADFSDRQLAELALDMGVPFRNAPWWGVDSSAEFKRWRQVFDTIGSTISA